MLPEEDAEVIVAPHDLLSVAWKKSPMSQAQDAPQSAEKPTKLRMAGHGSTSAAPPVAGWMLPEGDAVNEQHATRMQDTGPHRA